MTLVTSACSKVSADKPAGRGNEQQNENPMSHRLEAEIETESSADIDYGIVEERFCRVVGSEVGAR